MRLHALRSERGQSAAEYMGILLLVAAIIGALIASNLDDKIANTTNDMVALIAGGGKDDGGGGGNGPGGGGNNPGGGGNNPGGGGNNPGGGGNNPGGGGNDPGGGGNDPGGGSTEDETNNAILCLGSAAELGNCLRAAGAPNAVSEKITERAADKVKKAQRKLYNTSRPGTPDYVKALAERDAALKEYFNSRKLSHNFIVKPLAQVRKVVDPRIKDIQKGMTTASKGLNGSKATGSRSGKVAVPNTSSGGPVKPSAASNFMKGLGKVGKGLGIAGTALSLYDNVKNDGVAKGVTKTAGGVAGAWAGGAAVVAVCGAIGVATAGVGGLACAGGAFVASYFGGKYGSQIAGWGYDRAKDLGNFADDKVFKPVSHATTTAVNKVKDVGEKAIDGGKKVIGALNPFG